MLNLLKTTLAIPVLMTVVFVTGLNADVVGPQSGETAATQPFVYPVAANSDHSELNKAIDVLLRQPSTAKPAVDENEHQSEVKNVPEPSFLTGVCGLTLIMLLLGRRKRS